jgi:hypothetical protein
MSTHRQAIRVATFCGKNSDGCPVLWMDPDATHDRRVEITDDFGQKVQMSLAQLAELVADVKKGVLDELLPAPRNPQIQGELVEGG